MRPSKGRPRAGGSGKQSGVVTPTVSWKQLSSRAPAAKLPRAGADLTTKARELPLAQTHRQAGG